jgi:uncharacterized damage-inducible protein DinB
MNESERTLSLFKKLYNGSPWIDINISSVLKNVSTEQASKRVLKNCNTVWEITNHLIGWRLDVLERVQGKTVASPENNYFEPVTDTSEKNWADTLKRLSDVQNDWIEFLDKADSGEFEKVYASNNMTYYEHIHGIIQHDAYHLGQIVLLLKKL